MVHGNQLPEGCLDLRQTGLRLPEPVDQTGFLLRFPEGILGPLDNVPHAHGLNLVADLHTAHTFDTFCRITDDRERMIPWLVLDLDLVWDFNNIQLSGKSLQITIIASYTGGTAKIML